MYRFTIDRNDLGNFRNTTIDDAVAELTPDGFTCDSMEQGESICARYGWAYAIADAGESRQYTSINVSREAKRLGVVIGQVTTYADGTCRIDHVDGSTDDYRDAAAALAAVRQMAE